MPRKPVSKSSLYRAEVTEAAVKAVHRTVANSASGKLAPQPLDYRRRDVRGQLRPAMRQADRAIDWGRHTTAEIARRVRAADSSPGVLTTLLDHEVFIYGAHEEDRLTGPAGRVIAQRHGAVCVGTVDGALWLSHMKLKAAGAIKLPAADVLHAGLQHTPHVDVEIDSAPDQRTFRDIRYWEGFQVGYLAFDFYNGAMSTEQCRRLRDALRFAQTRPTRVICLLGGRDFFSNGIHLNVIEAADDPAHESWRNINAMDDLVLDVLNTRQILVSALRGNAGAGGVMLALAADRVYARRGVVLNPHYQSMGGLYGSEYWTYTLPRRVGEEMALQLTTACQPMGVDEAHEIGLIDGAFGNSVHDFDAQLESLARALAEDPALPSLLADKQQCRLADEGAKPLASYRAHELKHMADNFFGPDHGYHDARRRFVHKQPTSDSAQRGHALVAA